MSDSDVRKALIGSVDAFLQANGFSGAIKWENTSFDPSKKEKWVSVFFVPNQPNVVTLGMGGSDRVTGFMQVDLNIAQGKGDGDMNSFLDAARAEFVAGKSYTLNAAVVTVINTGESQGRMVDNWFRKSITIAFRADIPRTSF